MSDQPHPHDELFRALEDEPDLRTVVQRMAALARAGRLPAFVDAVRDDAELNGGTRRWLLRVAGNEPFLREAERRFGAPEPRLQSPFAGAISSVG